MKVLVMTPLWGRFGGREQYVTACIEELIRKGHPCVVAYGQLSPKPACLESERVPLHQFKNYSQFISEHDAAEAEHLRVVLNLEQPDVVFISDVKNFALLSQLMKYGATVPMSHDNFLSCMRVTTTTYFRRRECTTTLGPRCLLHGCFLKKAPNRKLRYNRLSAHLRLLSNYQQVGCHVVASHYMKQRLVHHGFRPNQVRVIPYFTDIQAPDGPMYRNAPLILFVGRIDRYKGLDYLLRALRRINQVYKCVVIGDGDQASYCKSLARTLKLNVEFVGWATQQQIASWLTCARMLVVPSIWPEPFGIVGIEAMVCSTPVIAFNAGGISDWLQDGSNGYLVPVKNTALLAARIEELLSDPNKAAQMGAEGRLMVVSKFTKEQHFAQLLSCFEQAAEERASKTTCRLPS